VQSNAKPKWPFAALRHATYAPRSVPQPQGEPFDEYPIYEEDFAAAPGESPSGWGEIVPKYPRYSPRGICRRQDKVLAYHCGGANLETVIRHSVRMQAEILHGGPRAPVVIFDCNGVLADSETLATQVLSEQFIRAGFVLTPDVIARYFTGRRPADIFEEVEIASGRRLPDDFGATVREAILRRFREELRATPYAAQALSWIRGTKCVASSSSLVRIRVTLETADLIRFFEPNLFSASQVKRGKPAPDLFLHAAARMGVDPKTCIVVEDSPVGVSAAIAAGMRAIGFVGGSHAGSRLDDHLRSLGASAVISDMRALKTAIVNLRGW
jgi:HAD superfamily hydrolase (TIGR01509 family)